MCQHIDFSNTLDGAKCNDCGMEISSYQEARNEIENGKNEVVKAPRYCSECGEGMWDGFCVDGGCEYYCSEKCLHKHYTEKEWEEMSEGDSDSYWTEWDEDDIEDEDEDGEDVFGLNVEEILEKNGFRAYKNINEGETIFWSKEDLMKNDEKKQWFYA